MSLISSLLRTGAANPQAHLKISRNSQGAIQGVVAKGKSTMGRVVEWFREVGGGRGSVENQEMTQALIDDVRTRYGKAASDAVSQQLRDRLREGKPLSYRHVELAVVTAKDVSIKAQAEKLANLGDGAIARQIIDDLVKQGALSPGGRDALLTQGSKDRAALEEAIKRAVLDAAPQDDHRPLDPPTAFIAVEGAVHEAAAPLLAAAQADQWSALGDDMDSPPMRAVIGELVAKRQLSEAGAKELLSSKRTDHAFKMNNRLVHADQLTKAGADALNSRIPRTRALIHDLIDAGKLPVTVADALLKEGGRPREQLQTEIKERIRLGQLRRGGGEVCKPFEPNGALREIVAAVEKAANLPTGVLIGGRQPLY
jgi:hypothetical protein